MDEITMFKTIQPPPPDGSEALLRRARARLETAMLEPQPAARSPWPTRHGGRYLLVTCTAAAAACAALVTTFFVPSGGTRVTGVRTDAYVVLRHVQGALANTHLVMAARTQESLGGSTISWATWADGSRSRTVEFSHGRSEVVLAAGTALVGGKLTSAYVTYYNRKYSLSPQVPTPVHPCSTRAALELGGPSIPVGDWRALIGGSLGCGAAAVSGHVRINGVETTKITGKPVTMRLPLGEAREIGEKWLTARWTLYVNPTTYLPVRMASSTRTFGGRWPSSTDSSVTDVRWLPPTQANIAKARVTIPAGFHRVSSPADQ
jgi:hypothetical protein